MNDIGATTAYKLLINSRILEALFQEQCTFKMRIQTELPTPVWYLADFWEMAGKEMEPDLTLSSKSARLRFCQPLHVRPEQYTD